MKIADNLPQWVIDIFNILDFKRIKKVEKIIAINFLSSWANSNLYLANPEKKYPIESKRINKNFDRDLLKLLNSYDYSNISEGEKRQLNANLSKWISQFNIPIKKNYESIYK